MNITLFTKKPIFSGSNHLYKGLVALGHDVTFCAMVNEDPYNYVDEVCYTDPNCIINAIDSCDMLILSASVTIDWVLKYFNSFKVLQGAKIVIGDSNYCRDAKRYNDIFQKCNIDVNIMPDIAHYCTGPHKIYYPPCNILENDVEYNTDPFIISHLPGIKYESGIKGTRKIEEIVSKIDGVEFICQGTTDWKEAIEIKKRSSLYIDQMVSDNRFGDTYKGGLGKNGIEAMMLGIPVITSGTGDIPMWWIDEDNLEHVIGQFIKDRQKLEAYRMRQQSWALNNCTDIAAARRLI